MLNKKAAGSMQKKKLKLLYRGPIAIPSMEMTTKVAVGTLHAKLALTDEEGTLGIAAFCIPAQEIQCELNAAHPHIRAAALANDLETLTQYVSELCFLGAAEWHLKHDDWPWPHPEWDSFVEACEVAGSPTRGKKIQ